MPSLSEQLERLVAETQKIRAAIRRDDAACWSEYAELFAPLETTRRTAPDKLDGALHPLIRYAAERDALECLRVPHAQGYPLARVRGPARRTLLHDAARRGAERVMAWLLDEHLVEVNARAHNGLTALHYAAQGGHAGTVKRLLARHAFIDAATRDGATALHEALYYRHAAVADVLIRAGANLCATTSSEDTPLRVAARRGLRRIADLLLEHGAVTASALPDVIRFYGVRILAHRRLKDVSLDVVDQEKLGRLFEDLNPAKARVLLDRGADPDTAAVYALRNKAHRLLQVIRGYREVRYTDAHYRAAAQSALGMRQLLAHGGDPNALVEHEYRPERRPLLFYVAGNHDTDLATIPLLLDHGADPTPPQERGARPLIVELAAERRESAPLIRELVARGHDVNGRDRNDRTALHVLMTWHWDDAQATLLRELLRLGANPNAADSAGCTPLMYAVGVSPADVALAQARVLLDAGVEVNAIDRQGRTALHHVFESARQGQPSDRSPVLELLMRFSADLHACDSEGHYPEDSGDVRTESQLRDYLRRTRKREALSADPTRPALTRRALGL